MKEVESTVSQLQQLVIDERKRRMSMENQLSVVQDKIGAAELKSTVLESKNKQLETEVATIYNEQMMSQSNPIASGSGVSSSVQMIGTEDGPDLLYDDDAIESTSRTITQYW